MQKRYERGFPFPLQIRSAVVKGAREPIAQAGALGIQCVNDKREIFEG